MGKKVLSFWFLVLSWGVVWGQPAVPPPRPATQAEVNEGTATRPYVSPATLAGLGGLYATSGITAVQWTQAFSANIVAGVGSNNAATATLATNLAASGSRAYFTNVIDFGKYPDTNTITISGAPDPYNETYTLVKTNGGYLAWRGASGTNFITRDDTAWIGLGEPSPFWSIGKSNDTLGANIPASRVAQPFNKWRQWVNHDDDSYYSFLIGYGASGSNTVLNSTGPIIWTSGITNSRGKTYYVNGQAGNDLNDGLSTVSPFATIVRGLILATNSGDGIIAFGGSYADGGTMSDGTFLVGIGKVSITNSGLSLGANCLLENITIGTNTGAVLGIASGGGNTIVRNVEAGDNIDGLLSSTIDVTGDWTFENCYFHSTFDAFICRVASGGTVRLKDCRFEAWRTGTASNETRGLVLQGAGSFILDGCSVTISNTLSMPVSTNAMFVISSGACNLSVYNTTMARYGVGQSTALHNSGSGAILFLFSSTNGVAGP